MNLSAWSLSTHASRRKVKTCIAPQMPFELNRWQSRTIHRATSTKNRLRVPPFGFFVGLAVPPLKALGSPEP
jgi:hypothetical protein